MKKSILLNAGLNFILTFMFVQLLIQSVQISGWTFFSILIALIATYDFVQGFRMMMLYINIRQR